MKNRNGKPVNERRRAPRISTETDVLVKIQSAPEARELEGTSLPTKSSDISLGGLCMHVGIPLPVGTLLELKISFQDSSARFWLTGNVVWNNSETGMVGIQFNLGDSPHYYAWNQAISRLLPSA